MRDHKRQATIFSLIAVLFFVILFILPRISTKSHEPTGAAPVSMPPPPPNWNMIRILTANVGNLDFGCRGRYNNKLCYFSVEAAISQNIKKLKPDVVFLQEVLHPSQLEGWLENDPQKVGYNFEQQEEKFQPRRLLGSAYSIACFTRMRETVGHPVGFECIAVQIDSGIIEGCPPGDMCTDIGLQDQIDGDCNPEFVVGAVSAVIHGQRISLVNAHPHSRSESCRTAAIRQIFESTEEIQSLTREEKSIIAGDFNFDPFRERGRFLGVWEQFVGPYGSGKPFYYHSGIAEKDPPYPTVRSIFGTKTVDHVLSNFGFGSCVTLGEAKGTNRLDNGEGMDHRAVLCDLAIPRQNP
jgi:endonuclease/exonuclease/phosphatase family metal-dependent hydrolase